jgi:hypothetical protein
MTDNYISRTLIVNRDRSDERIISEAAISSIDAPIIILGDPGSGKTELTKTLEEQFGYARIPGGTFYRNRDVTRFSSILNTRLIIDGLDEIASSSGVSAIDEVLKKLSQIGNPNFILSCRSADWQGSTDRYKISEDYGVEPVTLHLQPFTYENAKDFLGSYNGNIDARYVLEELDRHDLSEFYVNPLTLTLVAEIAAAGQGLPKGRVELLDRASELLTSEKNPAHQRSSVAQSSLDALLDSAGAAFSHLLLSGSIGLTDRPREQIPDGYVLVGELNNLSDAPNISTAIKTRLFQSPDENLYIPFHRVIAEYLGARWLSKRLSNGLSERRVFQSLTFAGGVPTAFRGIHAWLAHFSPRLAPRCIQADPYGVLRYGEPDRLPLYQARLLLDSLASLANEDPYFRSEDWGKRAISGLARPELKNEVVAIIMSPDRHVHLSTLILEALDGSPLTKVIAQELLAIIKNSAAAYIERSHAADALIGIDIDWPTVTECLQARKESGDKRLVLEIIALTRGLGFAAKQIANAILDYQKFSHHSAEGTESDDEKNDDPYVSGMVYGITQKISPKLSGEVLDEVVLRIQRCNKPEHWKPEYELSSGINLLVERAIVDDDIPSPERVWSWLKLLENEGGYSSERKRPVHNWLTQNPELRRKIQRIAFSAASGNDGPWITIVHDLPAVNRGLALSALDVVELLTEIGSKENLDNFDIALWTDLVRSQQSANGVSEEIRPAVSLGRERHSILEQHWEQITAPPKRDWRKEEEDRKAHQEQEQVRKFSEHRAHFLPHIKAIASGEAIGILEQIAKAYLGRYSDLNQEAHPDARVREWLGDELTSAALAGLVSTLSRNDTPSAQQIAETHVQGKYRHIELVLVCGIAELVRLGLPLSSISTEVAMAALAAWWVTPDAKAERLGEGVQEQLVDLVLSSQQSIEEFLSAVVEPHIRAGHQYVPGLYRIPREDRFKSVAGRISLRWLGKYPSANSSIQLELLQMAIAHGLLTDVRDLVRERLSSLQNLEISLQRMWMSAAFLVDFEGSRETFSGFISSDKDHLWSIGDLIRRDRHEGRSLSIMSIQQREFIVRTFGGQWPPAPRPSSSSGDKNPWNATEFIRGSISAIGADPSEEASASLDRLMSDQHLQPYLDHIKHTRAQQLRLRRDAEFRVSTFEQIKQTLAGGLPGSIDDLKAMIMDRLETIQDYVRNGDTNAWEAFWNNDKPKVENTCRDRLLDQLRLRLPLEINLLPEITMPEANRADIVAVYRGYGLPIEIKGQWHTEAWNAASVQLIEKYARDWRADDRGVYLVLWFGKIPRKNLPKHPEFLSPPSSPDQLRDMLVARLAPAERTRIDVFVLDVSKPKLPSTRAARKPSARS